MVTLEADDRLCAFIATHKTQHGYPPTYRQMADHFHVALSTIHQWVARAQRNGRITKAVGLPRTIFVVPPRPEDEVLIEVVLSLDPATHPDPHRFAIVAEEAIRAVFRDSPGVQVRSAHTGGLL